jgi:hypothetical protein
MDDAAPGEPILGAHRREQRSQRPTGPKPTDVLHAGIEYETPDNTVATSDSSSPRGAVATGPVVGLDDEHFESAAGKQRR